MLHKHARRFVSFVRWNLKTPRYIGKFFYSITRFNKQTVCLDNYNKNDCGELCKEFTKNSYIYIDKKFNIPELDFTPYKGTSTNTVFID